MIKRIILLLLMLDIIKCYSQDYLISFVGTGSSNIIDSVLVENITQGKSVTIPDGNQLRLLGITSVNNSVANNDNLMRIYPNPSEGKCILELFALTSGGASLEIYNIAGIKLAQKSVYLTIGKNSYSINELGTGLFHITIKTKDDCYTGTIISYSDNIKDVEIKNITSSENLENGVDNLLKTAQNEITMQYNTGDRLKLTGISGIYSTVVMDMPTENKTITFNFITCTDGDNNNYPVIYIGERIWMAENLRTTHYVNGTPIPKVSAAADWNALTSMSRAYCWYNHDSISYSKNYGALYTWSAAMDSSTSAEARGACPIGWHIPTQYEYFELVDVFGGFNIAGGNMKETGTTHWNAPNEGATNSSGFTALPGGNRSNNGEFELVGQAGYWWTSTQFGINPTVIYLNYNSSKLNWPSSDSNSGYSIRCVKY